MNIWEVVHTLLQGDRRSYVPDPPRPHPVHVSSGLFICVLYNKAVFPEFCDHSSKLLSPGDGEGYGNL